MTQMYSEFLTRMTGNDPAFESGEITEETIGDTKYMLYFLDVGQNRPVMSRMCSYTVRSTIPA